MRVPIKELDPLTLMQRLQELHELEERDARLAKDKVSIFQEVRSDSDSLGLMWGLWSLWTLLRAASTLLALLLPLSVNGDVLSDVTVDIVFSCRCRCWTRCARK